MRRCALLGLAVAWVLAGCGSGHRASTTAAAPFPSTPAGVQAQWLLGAVEHLPVSAAALRAHVKRTLLALQTPAELTGALAQAGQIGLVSVSPSRKPNSQAFVISVRGGQRFRVNVGVDSRGLISALSTQPLPATASPGSVIPPLTAGWVAQPVAFDAAGVRVYGTYTHPSDASSATIPGAVLIGGSGATDRNGNSSDQPQRNTYEAVANWLSADGVASLRYDKLGSGQTGWGRYASHPERVGIRVYEQEAAAALSFLARQRQIDRARLAVFGHSQGGIYALLLATGLAGKAPKVHAVVLLEPVSVRMLDLFKPAAGAKPSSLSRALARAVASLRRTGALPSGLPAAIANDFNPHNWGTHLELSQIDRYDPAAVASRLTPGTPVLLTCSNFDPEFPCAVVDHLAAGLSHAKTKLDYVHLVGVDHFLKEDLSHDRAAYNEALTFSTQLQSELQTFLATNQ